MKFSDIIDLAKAGYKPSDIKELLQLQEEKRETDGSDGKSTEADGSDGKSTEADGSDGKPTKEKGNEGKKTEIIDYKKLYEEEKKLREELQDKNSRDPIDPEPLKIDEVIKSVKKSIS